MLAFGEDVIIGELIWLDIDDDMLRLKLVFATGVNWNELSEELPSLYAFLDRSIKLRCDGA